MTSRFALLGLVLLLAVPHVAADWYQDGADAARTGAVVGNAPAWNDVVARVPFTPTEATFYTADGLANPIVLGGLVYFVVPDDLTQPYALGEPVPGSTLYSVDLLDPRLHEEARIDWPMYGLATDGERLFVTGNYRAMAWTPGSQSPDWDQTFYHVPPEVGTESSGKGAKMCGLPSLTADALVIACISNVPVYGTARVVVAAFDPAGGDPLWEAPWESTGTPPPCGENLVEDPCNRWLLGELTPNVLEYRTPQLSLIGDRAFVARSHLTTTGEQRYSEYAVYVIEIGEGTGRILAQSYSIWAGPVTVAGFHVPAPTGNQDSIYMKALGVLRYSANDLRYRAYESNEFRPDGTQFDLGSGLALRGDRLYVTSLTHLFVFDSAMEPDLAFQTFQLPPGEAWDRGTPLVTDDLVILRATRLAGTTGATHTILYALDARTGALAWRHAFQDQAQIAVSDGLLIAVDAAGELVILGHSELSPDLKPLVSTRYPGIGELVHVDLGAATPGLHGPVTNYRVDWGNGHITDWQETPSFTHRYGEGVDRHARFFVRNHAGQTASVPMTFHVGQADPAVNLFNSPFSDQYQETTFFFLGLLITAVVAAIGIYRAGRKRRLFQEELRALEDGHTALLEDPRACDRMLSERRARARALFLEKRLEEVHASFLERRVDELRRGLRLGTIEEELSFLPYGMVVHLQRVLDDARVDAWERKHFLEALTKQNGLSSTQRALARKVIDGWFARDAEVL